MAHQPVTTARRFNVDGSESRAPSFAADEGGMISLASLIVVLVFLILIGLVGNVGQAVVRSMEAQNAADAAAVSTGVCVARGLNAVTAANHVMGELSALLVVGDAFLGPEEIPQSRQKTDESTRFNQTINVLKITAPWTTLATGTATGGKIRDIDERLVSRIAKMLTEDEGKHRSGATVYDARMTLKYLTCQGFAAKTLANAIALIGDATVFFSAAGEALAAVIHIGVDLLLVKIGQEWLLLSGVESGASALRSALGEVVPPVVAALSLYGDSVAGVDGLQSPVAGAAADALKAVREAHGMSAATAFPAPATIRLPVTPEPRPGAESAEGKTGKAPSLWGEDDWSGPGKEMDRLFKKVNGWVDDWNDFVDGILSQEFIPGWVTDKFKSIDDPVPKFPAGPRRSGGADDRGLGFPQNPSFGELTEMPWEAEGRSQWVRATYPHVDLLRQPAREAFHAIFGMSNASTYYVNWTNRYTLERSHTLRSDAGGPHMLLLAEMKPDRKGDEPWTTNPARAEQLFSVMGFIHREARPATFSPLVFKNPGLGNGGDVAYAEALVYNANGRDLGAAGRPRDAQPNTGWDTLNWEPVVKAREWGAPPTAGAGGKSGSTISQTLALPKGLFDVFRGTDVGPTTRIRLNWQAKLVPASPRRLRQALATDLSGEDGLPSVATQRLRKTLEFVPALGRH